MTGDTVYLRHILEAAEKIAEYVSVGRETFMAESHWQDAVIRQLEIIGEATKHLSMDIRRQHDAVPWRRLAGLRDVLIHAYMGVDIDAVWQLTQSKIPSLRVDIQTILHSMDVEGDDS
jgi:uncharacterized protein with HEPN domain